MNNCSFIGNLTADPIIKSTQTGRPMAMFTVACNESTVDNNTGEARQITNFVNCTAWGAMAEYVSKFFNKGKQVMVFGKYTSWSRTNQDGSKSYGSNITAQYVAVTPYSMSKAGNGQWGSKQSSGFQNGNNSQGQPPAGFDQFGPAESEEVPF